MKKVLLIALSLTLLVGVAFAKPMQAGPQREALKVEGMTRLPQSTRNTPEFSFSVNPTIIGANYYDYMVGSYNGLPIQVKQNGDGYFLIYHGRATSDAQYRRVYYAAIDATGIITDHGEITRTAKNEGYPAMAIDPVAGKPFYAWHGNADGDDELEVEVASDSYYEGYIGNFNEISVAIDNPWTTIDPNPNGIGDTHDNEYIWPQMAIGPSPVPGMRRVYVSGRNASNHTPWDGDVAPSENPLFAYADFDTDMIEFGENLVWHHTNIPTMDGWHLAGDGTWRRPSNSLFVDDIGNVYYVGHHFGYDADSNAIPENTADIFICPNYGEGEWVYVSGDPDRATWNPGGTPGGEGYFQGDDGAFADEDLLWNISNASHFNVVRLNNGKFLFPTIMAMSTHDGSYYPSFQYPKTVVIDPVTGHVDVNDIYPRKHEDDNFNTLFTPWDVEAPFGVPEYYVASDGESYLSPELVYPFPHYNSDLHESSMFFHYNGMKVSEPNEDGLMVAVWQDSYRAKLYNDNGYDEYAAYQNTPEIWVSVSVNGYDWSDPITINNVDTLPQFSNIKPMWVYPANKVITVSTLPSGEVVGKIGIMFLDDFTWGSTVHTPPAHSQNDGGNMMFMELQITFPVPESNPSVEDGTAPSVANLLNQNYPNPFNPETNISFDMPAAGNAKVEVFNVKGQLVKTLFNDIAPYGKTNVVWSGDDNNGNQVSSGVYFYRLNTEHGTQTRKMMLMK